jgi:dTDP-4-dehydrorhamnose reductase
MIPMRIAVTGQHGQVARALTEAGPAFGLTVVALGRPELDLAVPETVGPLLAAAAPDIVVNAAAYTAVDQAEREPEKANAINAAGAGAVAAAARALGVPMIHLSTDYVFDGRKTTPYVEEDPVEPTSVYGVSKLAGERTIAATLSNYVILRTAWVFAPYGKNFVRTMLALAQTRDEARVVADQFGCPSYAPDIAAAIVTIARNLLSEPDDMRLRGIFNLAGTGETSWADFAAAIFAILDQKGMRTPALTPITTADYPTAARRPANSRLDCSKLVLQHGVQLPSWHSSLQTCLDALTSEVDRLVQS